MTDDSFTLYGFGAKVDRTAFETLMGDQERWRAYLSLCRRPGPVVRRTIAAHLGSAWHLVQEGDQVTASMDRVAPPPAPTHPAITAYLALENPQPAGETKAAHKAVPGVEVHAFNRSQPLLIDLSDAGAHARRLSFRKGKDYRAFLYREAAKAFKERVLGYLQSKFYAKDGEVFYGRSRGQTLTLKEVSTGRKYKADDKMPEPGKVYLSDDVSKLAGPRLVDALDVLRELDPPTFVTLEYDPIEKSYALVMEEGLAHQILLEKGITEAGKCS